MTAIGNDARNLQFKSGTISTDIGLSAEPLTLSSEIAAFRRHPGLITLLVTGEATDTSWQQVVAFIRMLRQPWLPVHQPLIVLAASAPPDEILKAYLDHQVIFLGGPLLQAGNLLEAGVLDAQTVVVLRSDDNKDVGSGVGSVLTDYNAVLVASEVDEILAGSKREHFAIFEFATTHAVHLVENAASLVRGKPARQPSVQDCFVRKSSSQQWLDTSSQMRCATDSFQLYKAFGCSFRLAHLCQVIASVFTTLFTKGFAEGEEQAAEALHTKLIFHSRFAAGQIFTPDFFGGMFGHIFHFPGTIELVEALTMPSWRGQSNYPWQVRCPPKWIGHRYGDLVYSWISGDDEDIKGCGAVIIVAVYREQARDDGNDDDDDQCSTSETKHVSYNITMPGPSMSLRASDALTVLAGEEFGTVMASKGLLRGAETELRAEPELPLEKESEHKSLCGDDRPGWNMLFVHSNVSDSTSTRPAHVESGVGGMRDPHSAREEQADVLAEEVVSCEKVASLRIML
eukprot:gnl/TRDRNA2_/TRDRNA2_136825_c0_seq1.p1 gnl/TRDRNA2_/TRDRNA2_136825_c0~~gnl/TRDRNA2_/TRDRNA2_136825_c0_seq1.p1  ORF type:complete len:540 (-),score=60.36 gnl/TRDRNA2_/TRDRNA2_136825_c0_seq1:64-1602(-)